LFPSSSTSSFSSSASSYFSSSASSSSRFFLFGLLFRFHTGKFSLFFRLVRCREFQQHLLLFFYKEQRLLARPALGLSLALSLSRFRYRSLSLSLLIKLH
jgi:hypothetical protein